MLNRPTFFIRQFMSQHRSQDDDDEYWGDQDWLSLQDNSKRKQQSRSWMPSSRRKGSTSSAPAAPIVVRRGHSVFTISSPLPPQPDYTQNVFSPGSVPRCSYESESSAVMTRSIQPEKVASPLCSPGHGQLASPPLRPPRPTESLYSPEETASLYGRGSPSPSFSLCESGPDLFDHNPRRRHAISTLGTPTGWNGNLEQMFRETEDLFRPTDATFAEANPNVTRESGSFETWARPPALHRHSTPMPLTLGLQRLRDSPNSSPLGSPVRNASVKKAKKKSLKKPRANSHKSQVRAPRWAISENVTDILTGQRFRRLEADEMVAPKRMKELRRAREQARKNEEQNEELLRPRWSSDFGQSDVSDNTETSFEPFDLQDLPSRIEASGWERSSTVLKPPRSIPLQGGDLPQRSSQNDQFWPRQQQQQQLYSPLDAICPSPQSPLPPLPPRPPPRLPPRIPARSNAKKQRKKLPMIPELTITTPTDSKPRPLYTKRTRAPTFRAEENDEYFYLKSTPYTLTQPLFRHGPITFSKAEVGKGAKTMDDTLDWTAFQMAILGGAGDLFPDTSLEEDSKQAEDVASWFESFGFETYGELVPEEAQSPQRNSAHSTVSSSSSSSPSSIDTASELPIPIGSEYPSGFWGVSSSTPPHDAKKFYNNTGLRRWVVEDRQKRWACESPASMPASPMMPLFISSGDMSGDCAEEPVPMGYNLGHDLGDFLKWESEHVHAGGYYGYP